MDEVLFSIADKVQKFAAIYLVDITEVPDFNKARCSCPAHGARPIAAQRPGAAQMYELYDPCTVMFFFRNKHMMIDLGTGNNNKINWALDNKQEMIDVIETVYRGARKGRGLVVAPKGTRRGSSTHDSSRPSDAAPAQTTPRSIATEAAPPCSARRARAHRNRCT